MEQEQVIPIGVEGSSRLFGVPPVSVVKPALPSAARILVAEDDSLTRCVLRELLVADGYEVFEAATGREAVSRFHRHLPDLVLLDVHMPDGDGFDACVQMRALDPEESVPIVMLTASDDVPSIERAFQVRATDFISKPFKRQVLQQRIRYALRSRSLAGEVRRSREQQDVTLSMARLTFWEWRPGTDELSWSSDRLPVEHASLPVPDTASHLMELLSLSDDTRLSNAFGLAHIHGEPFDLEVQLEGGAAVLRILGAPSRARDGTTMVSGALQDVTSIRRSEALAEFLALHDELTGLENRRGFTDQLNAVLRDLRHTQDIFGGASSAEARADVAPPGVLLVGWLDISRFQRVNDALGEHVGNLLLTRIGRRIRTFLPSPHLVGRVGGDEFIVALKAKDEAGARQLFEALLLHLREPLVYPGGDATLSWSAGYSFATDVATDDGNDAAALLLAAETAQRSARAAGSIVEAAAREMSRGHAVKLLERERALRRALDDGAFRIAVQPQLDVRTQRVVGVETLLRWSDHEGREVSPAEFAPILEETGLIVEVGAWCLAEACRWQQRWQQAGEDLRVAVNLSPRQFADPQMLQRLSSILDSCGSARQRMEFELTESLAMQRPEHAASVLSALREQGARVAIDDFGVGYSSLSYLVQFPIDTIKLDRTFTSRMAHSRPVEAIVRAAVAIAESMGLTTIAEGVETEAEAQLLGALGVTELQGFHIARPMPPESLLTFIRETLPARNAAAAPR